MKIARRSLLTLTCLGSLVPLHQAAAPAAQAAESADELAAIAKDAYVFGYPLVTVYQTKAVTTNVAKPKGDKAPVNQFATLRKYPDASFKDVTAPNADTLYSSAWLDVGKEPIVFTYPDMGDRFFLFPMLDAYTEVIASPGKRTGASKGQSLVIAGPGWKGAPPDGMKVVRSPTNTVWILGRTYCTGTPEDYKAVHALQDKYRLVPLSSWGKAYRAPDGKVDPQLDMKTAVRAQVDKLSGEAYFALLAKLMKDNPPTKADAPMLERMAKIGIVPGQPFDPSASPLGADLMKAVQGAPKAGLQQIMAQEKNGGITVKNGWLISTKTGTYGTHYTNRAFITAVGLGANLPEDAVYPLTKKDGSGKALTGANAYTIHFAKGMLPPAKGFWSVTMYDDQMFFVNNPLNRYSISPRDSLKHNDDGSVDLYIQHAKPEGDKQSNWLPAPQGDFALMLRMYWPNEQNPTILDGSWSPPAVEQAGAPRMGRRPPRSNR